VSDAEVRFHQDWLGLIQPSEGLVVSIPVLVDAQCLERQPVALQQTLLELCPPLGSGAGGDGEDGPRSIRDLAAFLAEILGLTADLFDNGDALPADLFLHVVEGHQTLRPTLGLRRLDLLRQASPGEAGGPGEAETPAAQAGAGYVLLVWDLPEGLALDRPETVTGSWEYPPAAKFDRLLRHCRVPIGLLTNRRELRLVYAPHGETTGSLTFRLDDMAAMDGRPILDAFVMLLSVRRFYAVAREHQLPALLADSRRRQANVTGELADQVFQAVQALLAGFAAAAQHDGSSLLAEAAGQTDDHLYAGLLTVLLRLVVLLYAEDKGLLPVEQPFYERHLSLFGLFAQLQRDQGLYPDSMARRFGAWDRLLALFRAVHDGVAHGALHLPPRHGELFDPGTYPFLEGWSGGGAPAGVEALAAVRVPSVDDGTVLAVLRLLVFLGGQRLSYSSLDVEQIGSVYERLMGYHVKTVLAAAVCLRPERVWMTAGEILAVAPSRRAKWLQEETGLAKAQAEKLTAALAGEISEAEALGILETFRMKGTERAAPGQLVIQPGAERRRTSSHYTPKSLTGPIVRRTLEPLLRAIADGGTEPPSERILSLRICDPAMGSGAFLVEACRFLADQLVAAWTREGRADLIASPHGDVNLHARRLVAQTCLYGVDKNHLAVGLAKISLWLVTMARDLPFTFIDHALRHGDSLVGLTFEQIRGFHWQPTAQMEFCSQALETALEKAIAPRLRIQELAEDSSPEAQDEKEQDLWDADGALTNVRLIADLIVGAYFSASTDKERKKELSRRLGLVNEWLQGGGYPSAELRGMQEELRETVPAFHWMIEFPEVFYVERPDPLDGGKVSGVAWMDAFIGNPPFLGGKRISTELGDTYADWLASLHGYGKNGDLCAHFFRRTAHLLGDSGAIGLLATNTIAQGDTRELGLKHLLVSGMTIYNAIPTMLWPGEAAVAVSVVHLVKGIQANQQTKILLNGKHVSAISSYLKANCERPDAEHLQANSNLSFVGSYVLGLGFILTPEERHNLVQGDPNNARCIFPYLGGEEVNSSPTQQPHRYVINFGSMSLSEADHWPDLIAILRERAKPERDVVKRDAHRRYWWHYGDKRPALYRTIAGRNRCLVTARVTKHLCFSFQPTNRIFSDQLCVFPLCSYSAFTVLQYRGHKFWARLLSSSMREDLRYSASDCFETFPFPHPDPRTVISSLEDIGQRLYDTRAQFMLDTQQGLTTTYNLLKDPTCHEPRIEELRQLHEEMDHAVLDAYGWSDIPVPPYGTPTTDAERRALEAFEDEVIDRLFLLNAERAAEEKRQSLASPPPKGSAKRGRPRKPKDETQAQSSLLLDLPPAGPSPKE